MCKRRKREKENNSSDKSKEEGIQNKRVDDYK